MVSDINKIKSTDWSRKVGSFGNIVENNSDIEQSINIIIDTPTGSVPLMPEFGCDIDDCVDMPLPDSVANANVRIIKALERWEKRIKVTAVSTSFDNDETSHIYIDISYTVIATNERKTIKVTL